MNIVIALEFAVFLIWNSLVTGQQHRGVACVVRQTNQNGTCQFIGNCPSLIDDLRKGIYPTRCGLEGNEIIICCSKRKRGEISNKKCAEYAQYVWTVETSPILIIGAEDIKKRDCPFNRLELVVGGQPATRKEFPHMAQLGYEGKPISYLCGGSLISERYILTAAHCLNDRSFGEVRYARLGMVDIDDPDHMQEFHVIERIAHPNYEDPSHYADIGLVQLDRNANLNIYVRPACLYTKSILPWTNVIATGWGKTDDGGSQSTVLLRVVLELYSQPKCNKVYKHETGTIRLRSGIKNEMMICAGHSKQLRDTCQGDSGGPLQVYKTGDKNMTCMYDIIGVTSFGKSCGLAVNIPGVYTRVAQYLEWIEDQVWPAK